MGRLSLRENQAGRSHTYWMPASGGSDLHFFLVDAFLGRWRVAPCQAREGRAGSQGRAATSVPHGAVAESVYWWRWPLKADGFQNASPRA